MKYFKSVDNYKKVKINREPYNYRALASDIRKEQHTSPYGHGFSFKMVQYVKNGLRSICFMLDTEVDDSEVTREIDPEKVSFAICEDGSFEIKNLLIFDKKAQKKIIRFLNDSSEWFEGIEQDFLYLVCAGYDFQLHKYIYYYRDGFNFSTVMLSLEEVDRDALEKYGMTKDDINWLKELLDKRHCPNDIDKGTLTLNHLNIREEK